MCPAHLRLVASTCETAPVGDLQMLANAARHAGRPQRANQVYQTICRRFPGGDAAANSAFLLGRLALGASPQRARMWLSTYLAERPHGAQAQEALGRILEIDQGDPVQGAETARRYPRQQGCDANQLVRIRLAGHGHGS